MDRQPSWARGSSLLRFRDHTQTHTLSRTPLDEWSAPRRDLYLTTHNTHKRKAPMPPVEFEPTISARERPQTPAVDRAASGTGKHWACPQFEISLHTQVSQLRQQIAMFCVSPFCHFIGRPKSIAARSESNILYDDDADDSRNVCLLIIQSSDAADRQYLVGLMFVWRCIIDTVI